MTRFNYEGRVFAGTVNYDEGDFTRETRFFYHQKGSTVWGTCHGGNVVFGTLIARVEVDGILDMVWQCLNNKGAFRTGTCRSTPEVLPDGRYRLHEVWRINSGESGISVIEEVSASDASREYD